MAAAPAVELELDFLVWKDKNGTEQVTPAHTFPSGTKMLFQQSSAPVGWTKSTTHDNKALRVTSGTASSGGNSAFNTVFGKTATNNHTLTAAQMPKHSHTTNNTGGHTHHTSNTGGHTHNTNNTGNHGHTVELRSGGFNSKPGPYQSYAGFAQTCNNANWHTGAHAHNTNTAGAHYHNTNTAGAHSHNTNNAGSGGAHSHGIDLRVYYVDVIIATKD